MIHIVVDLEMNKVAKKSGIEKVCAMETIEIGAVMLNDNHKEIGSFKSYVRPEYNDIIIPSISRLTGITDKTVADAPGFNTALRLFTDWCLCMGDKVKIYAWSSTDYKQICKEMKLKKYLVSEREETLLKVEWVDFQREFDKYIGFEKPISLKLALDLAGIGFVGREHDALYDARNTAKLLNIFNNREMFDLTLKKVYEAMQPRSFGTSLGSLFDFSQLIPA